jgi:NAD(P)-dependent dehydrogenase (short-subunit alcohol dehydrogenase family)
VVLGDINFGGAGAKALQIVQQHAVDLANVGFIRMDVTNAEDWRVAVAECVARSGRLDICVNNAGTTYKNKLS